ncbi:hypothetical protein [Oceanobacter mangrovi]|uniref:hypothetical protein n=1 Tax=Oceanobacter mangrovi TaxID=2862510 RepID=UPI001C8E96FB|nr:hypothetical protein [Oceanobacter mangrovi]
MIRCDVSTMLAKPLARHIRSGAPTSPDLYWRADLVVIGTEPCVVAEEIQTGYVMVFCCLDERDFGRFPQLFRDRFWRELAAICKHTGAYDSQTLASGFQALFADQYYHHDPYPIEEGRVLKASEKLERHFLYKQQPLPADGRSAFEFGFAFNSRQGRNKDAPTALEMMGNHCLNWLEQYLEENPAVAEPDLPVAVTSIEDNIVTVDFGRSRR